MATVISVQILSDVPGVKTVHDLINSLIPLIKALEGLAAVFTWSDLLKTEATSFIPSLSAFYWKCIDLNHFIQVTLYNSVNNLLRWELFSLHQNGSWGSVTLLKVTKPARGRAGYKNLPLEDQSSIIAYTHFKWVVMEISMVSILGKEIRETHTGFVLTLPTWPFQSFVS